jgi:hypothetical protein
MEAQARLRKIVEALRTRAGPMKAFEWRQQHPDLIRMNEVELHHELLLRMAECVLETESLVKTLP